MKVNSFVFTYQQYENQANKQTNKHLFYRDPQMQPCFAKQIQYQCCVTCGFCPSALHIIVMFFLIICLSVYVSNSRYRVTLLL